MTSFPEARALARQELQPGWSTRGGGTFYVSPTGYEDDEWWLVQYGAEEYWRHGNRGFLIADPLLFLVHKESGRIERMAYLDDPDRIDAMEEVKDNASTAGR